MEEIVGLAWNRKYTRSQRYPAQQRHSKNGSFFLRFVQAAVFRRHISLLGAALRAVNGTGRDCHRVAFSLARPPACLLDTAWHGTCVMMLILARRQCAI